MVASDIGRIIILQNIISIFLYNVLNEMGCFDAEVGEDIISFAIGI